MERLFAVANGAQILIFAASGIAIGRVARRGEAEFEAINTRYRAERAEAARQSEIDVARRHLVRSVQAAAIDIGDLLAHDRPRARQRSAAIATQLRAALSKPDDAVSAALIDAVLGAVVDAAVGGLMVETTFRIDNEVERSVMEALVVALRAALQNIIDHAGTDRAVLRIVADARYVQMTLRDRGQGRDGLQATDISSVQAALKDARAGRGPFVPRGGDADSDRGSDMSPAQQEGPPSGAAVERTAAGVAVAARILAVVTAVVNTASCRATLRRPSVMYVTTAGLVANMVASTRRQLRTGQLIDDRTAQRDALLAIGVLAGEAVARSDRFRYPGARPGTDLAPVSAGLIAVESSDNTRRRWALGGLCAAIWATTSGGRPDGAGLSMTQVVTDVGGASLWAGVWQGFTEVLRTSARVVREAYDLEVAETVRVEQLRERSRQHRLLHDSVLQVFEAIAANLTLDAAEAIALLERELSRLTGAAGGEHRISLAEGLDELRSFAQTLGLDVTCHGNDRLELSAPALNALVDASREAMANIRKHAMVTDVSVTVEQRDGGVELTVADRGVGFEPATVTRGFGVAHSIHRRLADIGGTSIVDSAPSRGTRVTLWAPC